MGVRQFVIGAALSAALIGILPVTAGADRRMDSRFGSVRDWTPRGGASETVTPKPRTRSPAVQDHGQVFDPLSLRSRFDVRSSRRLPQEINHMRLVAELRKLIRVAVQKSACHPRGKPPHGRFGYTWVGYFPWFGFDDDRGEHDGRGHHGHEPPFCPSPH